MERRIKTKIILAWIATTLLIALFSFFAMSVNITFLKFIEAISSWGTAACILVLGLIAAFLVAPRSKSRAI